MPVTFSEQIGVILKERKTLKLFVLKIFSIEGYSLDKLNFVFCSDEYLKSINNQFLNHDYYTDIITFDLSSPNTDAVSGEIYISIDRVKENAIIHKESFIREIHRVIFHGALHLCGYKDKTIKDKTVMRSKENFYLDQYFLCST